MPEAISAGSMNPYDSSLPISWIHTKRLNINFPDNHFWESVEKKRNETSINCFSESNSASSGKIKRTNMIFYQRPFVHQVAISPFLSQTTLETQGFIYLAAFRGSQVRSNANATVLYGIWEWFWANFTEMTLWSLEWVRFIRVWVYLRGCVCSEIATAQNGIGHTFPKGFGVSGSAARNPCKPNRFPFICVSSPPSGSEIKSKWYVLYGFAHCNSALAETILLQRIIKVLQHRWLASENAENVLLSHWFTNLFVEVASKCTINDRFDKVRGRWSSTVANCCFQLVS